MFSLMLLTLIKYCVFVIKQMQTKEYSLPSIGLPVNKLIVNHESVPRNLSYFSPYHTFNFTLAIRHS